MHLNSQVLEKLSSNTEKRFTFCMPIGLNGT